VLLPATDTEPAAAEPKVAMPEHGRGETVLLMEDEQSLRDLAIRILTRNGYQVLVAATPADALRQTSDPAQPVDLLLTDVVMPRMLGHEIAALIRAIRPGLPVLFMSGYAGSTFGRKCADVNSRRPVHLGDLEWPANSAAR
jgi:CheY-like chemotaxis protein